MPQDVIEKFQAMTPAQDKKEIADLPQWVKIGMGMQYIGGLTAKEAATRCNRAPDTLRSYWKSPAGKKWRDQLKEIASDPKEVAGLILRSSISGVAISYLAAFEQAMEAGDYAEVARMSRDLLDREDIIGVAKSKQAQVAPQINITLWGSPEPVVVEEIPEADIDIIGEDIPHD
jgi:hypothetical protein